MEKQIFIVGGFVRDFVLGRRSMDKDFVHVGYTVQDMLDSGYEQVGKDFPVFLHPVTGDEHALARKERKTGEGYVGFSFETENVTLEEDLKRRDLSINSMAIEVFDDMKTRFVHVIDPFGGKKDAHEKVLRHTSDAFAEDPVRILRLARLRARFGGDWTVAAETRDLAYNMAKKGVLGELQPDRVWKEVSRALMEPNPHLFFETLLEIDCLKPVFPELYVLKSSLESYRWHPEGDSFAHTMLVLKASANMAQDLPSRVAALCHDLGKGLTPREKMPKHYDHDVNGVAVTEAFCSRMNVPTKYTQWAKKATRWHMAGHKLNEFRPKTWVKMFDDMDIRRDPDSVEVLVNVMMADARGRLGFEEIDVSDKIKVQKMADAYMSVKFDDLKLQNPTAAQIQEKMTAARIKAVSMVQ
jgi:tRNA nucleotidyltransferase (CCA-adding enzyme)